MQDEAISPLLTEESSGQEIVEGTQEPIIQPIPINLYPGAFAQPKNRPLPTTSSLYQVYILPTPEAYPTPEAPAPKAESIPSALPVQYFKKLVAFVKTFSTTSKTKAAHIAWHSGWFGCWFGFGAPGPRPTSSTSSNSLQMLKKTCLGGAQSPPLFVLIFPVLFYFILF